MNISNVAPQDSAYTKSDSSGLEIKRPAPEIKKYAPVIKQPILEVKTELSFDEKMDQVSKKEKIDDIVNVINMSNKSLRAFDRKLEMSVHPKTKEVMVKVIDTTTDEIIRELPPEKVLDGVAYRREMAGILIDRKI